MRISHVLLTAIVACSWLAACSQPTSQPDASSDGATDTGADQGVDVVISSGIGDPCEGSTQVEQGTCAEGQICLPEQFGFAAGYCTMQCGTCPSDSTCVALGGQFRGCLLNCTRNSDCRDGYRCTAAPGGRSVCSPTDGPTGTRDGEACFTTAAGPHQLPALARRTFSEANISLSRERSDTSSQAEGNVVVSPVNGAVAASYIAVGRNGAFMGVSTRLPDGTIVREGSVRDPSLLTTSDPVLAYDRAGRLHMVFLGYNVTAQGQPTGMRVRIASSGDDGRTWDTARAIEPATFCATGCDKPWIVIGPTPRAVLERDAGVPPIDASMDDGSVADADDRDGDSDGEADSGVDSGVDTGVDTGVDSGVATDRQSIYVGIMVQLNRGQTVELHVLRSDDGGQTFTPPMRFVTAGGTSATVPNLLTPAVGADGTLHIVHAALTTAGGNAVRFGDTRNRVVYRRSTDGGATWSNPVTVSRSTDSPVYQQPIVVVDGARVHTAYTTGTSRGAWDVVLATSEDNGATWQHRKVNDEPEACATHAFPWIVADPARNRVHALWLENRFGDGAAAYASCPSDPRMPCATNERVSDGSFTFETSREPGRWHGDYQGLTIGSDGMLWALWSDTRSGSPGMYLARGVVR